MAPALLALPPAPLPLLELPPEVLFLVFSSDKLSAVDTLSICRVCRRLRSVGEDERIWTKVIALYLGPVLDAYFDGQIPSPSHLQQHWHFDGCHASWKCHFFTLKAHWKALAQERSGRLLVQIGKQELSGRTPGELLSTFAEVNPAPPRTYGIYDVTDFTHHPGIALAEAAGVEDATEWFEMNAHSDVAIRRLESLAVPGLSALPYDADLEQMRRRRRRGRVDTSSLSWGAMLVWLLVLSLCVSCEGLCHCFTCDADSRETLKRLPALTVLFLAFYLCGGCYEVLRCWQNVRCNGEERTQEQARRKQQS